ncbi:sugar phosphate isomerase/epimerase [Aurantimonas sp. VKM B-3413]|uniref:sugar phosphate isomerase/epimerase family protein n=1 Tax=Aurantimonas sp. VKM B-3413 TaxID=2779401 RepID=UPI001E614CD1|nr:sugar phosphate isomerase/epimerase [Aurantimonas sp. VKM B-3413]MCB8840430.1 sugar phosphate isomerase/epimerase [Aurantimonas sp. VKM B-3413]
MALTAPLSFQLYSARNAPQDADVLGTIASAGFTNVETFGPNHDDPEGFRKRLNAAGLTAKSGHFPLQMIGAELDRVISICRVLGIEIVVAPYLAAEDRPDDKAEWQALGDRLGRLAADCADEGLRFAWHNHDFEFAALADGSLPIEHLLKDGVLWEADVAWMVRAGAEPAAWLERYAGRIVAVHVKDIAPEGENAGEDGWADVGAGVVDWDRLWPLAVGSGASLMIAEHDNPSDFARCARVSGAKLTQLLAANR